MKNLIQSPLLRTERTTFYGRDARREAAESNRSIRVNANRKSEWKRNERN